MSSYFNNDDIFSDVAGTKRNLFGRTPIFIPPKKSDLPYTKEELQGVLNDCFTIHNKNKEDIEYLFNYVRGSQPILNRSDKIIRPEINNMCVENVAKYITNFKTGYIWGEPILLIKNSKLTKVTDDYIKENITEKEMKKYYDDKIVGDVEAKHILVSFGYDDDASDEEKESAEKAAKERRYRAQHQRPDAHEFGGRKAHQYLRGDDVVGGSDRSS